MTITQLHHWLLEPDEAAALQTRLRERLVLTWDGRTVNSISGVDVSYTGNQACAAIVVLHYPDMTPLSAVTAVASITFPYIPGLLAFREGPIILAAWEKLSYKPDVLMFDGQGIAHPRGLGIAAHIGILLDIPTIGVAKSRLYGQYDKVGLLSGDQSELRDEHDPEKIIGAVVRTREKSKPLFISPGHLIDLEHAIASVLAGSQGYRLPEPIRYAHKMSMGGEALINSTTLNGI